MNTELRQIGERLAVQRGNLHLTQSELAEKTGLSVNHISVIESGSKAMRIDTMMKICEVLGLDYTYLVTGNASVVDANEIIEKLSKLKGHQYQVLMDVANAFIQDNKEQARRAIEDE